MSKPIGIHRAAVTVVAASIFVLSWSSGFLVPAIVSIEVSPLTLLVWRFVPLAAILFIVVAVTGAGRVVTLADVRRQTAIGLFAQFGYCTAVYAAVAGGVATGTTALIDAVQPLVVAMLVGPLLGLKVRGAQWLGLLVGAGGVALVVCSQIEGATADPATYLWPAVAMACLIIGTFLQRRTASAPGALATLTIHVAATAVALVLVAASAGALLPPASVPFWLGIAFAGAFPTLAAYTLYWWLLRRIGITALNALLFLVAPTTASAGALLLGESVTISTFAGFVLCGIGVAVVLTSEARARTSSSRSDPREVPTTEAPTCPSGPIRRVGSLARDASAGYADRGGVDPGAPAGPLS